MRNMRSISIKIRDIVSGLDALLLLLLDISLGELDEFLALCVYPRVVLVTILVSNSTLDMWPSCIQEDTPCIFYIFILLFLNLLLWWLRSNLWCDFSLLKLLHHIVMVILTRLHFILLLQLVHFKFKFLDFSLQVIIFVSSFFITSFHTHLTCGGSLLVEVLEVLDQRASNCTSRS
jgi:hypothetical protein